VLISINGPETIASGTGEMLANFCDML